VATPIAVVGPDLPNSFPFTLQNGATAAGIGFMLVLPPDTNSAVTLDVDIGVGGSITPEVSVDDVTWFPIIGINVTTGAMTAVVVAAGGFLFDTSGWFFFRARVTAGPGPITVLANDVAGAPAMALVSAVIAGAVTANQGAPAAVANAWPILVTDGTDTAVVLTDHPAAADPGLVVRSIPRKSAAATITSVTKTAINTTLLAANSARLAFIISNDTNRTLFVKFGAVASATSYTHALSPGEQRVFTETYTGQVDGVWAAGGGAGGTNAALITEIA
jgi:hypothetical protein